MASGPVPRNLIRETKLTLVCSASLDPFITGVCDWVMAGGCEFAFWLLTVNFSWNQEPTPDLFQLLSVNGWHFKIRTFLEVFVFESGIVELKNSLTQRRKPK